MLILLVAAFLQNPQAADSSFETPKHCGDYKSRILFKMGEWDPDPPKELELDYRTMSASILLFDRANGPGNAVYISATMMADGRTGNLWFCYACGFRFFEGKLNTEPKPPDCKIRMELTERESTVVRTTPPSNKMTLECDVTLGAIVTCNNGRYLDNVHILNPGDLPTF